MVMNRAMAMSDVDGREGGGDGDGGGGDGVAGTGKTTQKDLTILGFQRSTPKLVRKWMRGNG